MIIYSLKLDYKTSGNGGSERQETLIGKVQKFCFLPMPTGFSLNIGLKEPPFEERKRSYRNSSSVSQVSAVQAQTSASCCRTPSDCSDRIQRHCGRFKNSSNRVPVHKTVIGMSLPCKRPLYSMACRIFAGRIYGEFLKPPRIVNCELTIGNVAFICKIAAIEKMYFCKTLIVNCLCKTGNLS